MIHLEYLCTCINAWLAKIWNSVPYDFRSAKSLSSFKRNIKISYKQIYKMYLIIKLIIYKMYVIIIIIIIIIKNKYIKYIKKLCHYVIVFIVLLF